MKNRALKDIYDIENTSGRYAVGRLNRLSVAVFIIAEVAMVGTALIFLVTDRLSVSMFLISFVVYTILLLLLVILAYSYTKNTWSRLILSEEQYKNLYESSSEGVLYLDLGGRILQCNRAFAEMLGYSGDELSGRTHLEITPEEWHPVDEDVFENQVGKSGYSDEYFKEYRRKDGTSLPVTIRNWTVSDETGEPVGIWAIVRDISKRKEYEDFIRDTIVRLEEAYDLLQDVNRHNTEFVAMVTHEIRAPLGTIRSSLSAIEELCTEQREQTGELLEVQERAVQRISHLVDDLQDITRIDTGRLRLNATSDDPFELATRVVRESEPRFEEKGLTIQVIHAGGQRTGRYDPRRIEQALVNLLDNALKFTDAGVVTLRVECEKERIVFSVSDAGPGIPPDYRKSIFEKFVRVDRPEDRDKGGTGLGLAISKGIIEAHGGSIRVESSEQGGALFTFELPFDIESGSSSPAETA